MTGSDTIGTSEMDAQWIKDPAHRAYLRDEAGRQVAFFRPSLRADQGYDVLDWAGVALPRPAQELHTTTRMVHSFALAKAAGFADCDDVIDAGMSFLWSEHRDQAHGGYKWSVGAGGASDGTKLAYGHVFVLLAGASAKMVGHPEADRLIADVAGVIEQHYWEPDHGLLQDEFREDWTVFSDYRGMNANMHGVEAMLTAYEITKEAVWRERAGSILDFFVGRMAAQNDARLPEHYTQDWQVDPGYSGNPMFRPAGSTPGHSFELGRLALQYWDLDGRKDDALRAMARRLIEQAHADAWQPGGGYAYTLDLTGKVDIADRYWWPVTEAIGAYATLIKLDGKPEDEARYRALWRFAGAHFIDHDRGGWFPEIDAAGQPTVTQFVGKPDIYHSLQAALFPLVGGISRLGAGLGTDFPA